MAQLAPADPTLPQNDTPAQRAARAAQLAAAQGTYQWASVNSLPGVPVVGGVPSGSIPTLEWWLKLVWIVIGIAENELAVHASLIAQGVSDLSPDLHEADVQLVEAVKKDAAAIEARFASGAARKGGLIGDIENLADGFSVDRAVEDLRNHADKLQAMLTTSGTDKDALRGGGARTLETYREIFKTIPLPAIGYTFQEDSEFAWLRVGGPNSVLIEAIDAVPEGCAITAEQYAGIVAGDTLEAALGDGRLFQCDYAALSILQDGTYEGASKFVYCPIALFAVPPGTGSLVPVAIRCDPSNEDCPVMLPSTAADRLWGWQMAKLVVQVADGNYHELFVHLAHTHLVTEAIGVATHRQLSNRHPLWALIVPHLEGTFFINYAAATSLITSGGPIDHIFAGTIGSSQQTAAHARLTFNFADKMLPADFATRGVGTDSALTDYPYRDDGLLVWQAIGQWVSAYVGVYYDGDEAVAQDTELAAWAAAVIAEGKLEGFVAPATIDELVATLTMIVFTASAQHAAVNFPQRTVMEFAPAVTGALWQTAPTSEKGHAKADWLGMMPPQELALEQLKVLHLLGSLYYRPLGNYRSPDFPYPAWFQDPRVTGAEGPLAAFVADLQNVEEQIEARNANRLRPYPFLLPSQIPTSTNI